MAGSGYGPDTEIGVMVKTCSTCGASAGNLEQVHTLLKQKHDSGDKEYSPHVRLDETTGRRTLVFTFK